MLCLRNPLQRASEPRQALPRSTVHAKLQNHVIAVVTCGHQRGHRRPSIRLSCSTEMPGAGGPLQEGDSEIKDGSEEKAWMEEGGEGGRAAVDLDGWFVAQKTAQVWALGLPLAFGGVQMYAEARGMPPTELTLLDQAVGSLLAQAAELVGVGLILQEPRASPPMLARMRVTRSSLGWGLAGGLGAAAAVGSFISLGGAVGEGQGLGAFGGLPELLPTERAQVVVLLAARAVVLGPLTEELVYRGFLLDGLLRFMTPPQAVFISSALFAGSHLSAGQLLPLGALGAILGAVHIRAGRNVFAAVLSHALYNGLILLATVLSLPPPST